MWTDSFKKKRPDTETETHPRTILSDVEVNPALGLGVEGALRSS